MSAEWRPAWVQKIDGEIAGYEKERDKAQAMVEQCNKKIGELREKRSQWPPSATVEG